MHSISPQDPDARFRYVVLIASMLMLFIGTGSVYFLVVALKPIAADFDWPRAVPSFAYSLQYLGAGVGGIVMGYWLDRSGMKGPAIVGAISIAVGSILMKYVSEIWQFYILFGVFMGLIGRSTLFAPLMSNITRWFVKNPSMAVGVVGTGQSLAGAVWPPVFQYLNDSIGWRETSFYYGVFVLLTMTPLALVFRRSPNKQSSGAAAPRKSFGNNRAAAASFGESPQKSLTPRRIQGLLSIASIGCCISMSLPLAHIVAHVSDLGYSPSRGAEALSIMLICASLSSFFGVGYLGSRFGGLWSLFCFSAIQALILGLLAVVEDLPMIYLVAALFGLGYGGVLPSYPVIVREFLPAKSAGRRTATVILFAGSGMAIGAWMGGLLFDLTGSYTIAFLIGVVCNVGNLLIIGRLIHLQNAGRLTPQPAAA
ncbi:MAG: MFS transporter [Alphaproteobacteria bacterium]|nr:MFS transporter [Alphaproteobacteria bacterium]